MNAPSRRDPLSSFLDSMPARYRRQSFDATDIREHAAIVSRGAGAEAHVEVWRRIPSGGAVVCVVAKDRPGLLSFIGAAILASGLDVESAQAHTRGLFGEAVDFFWLRRRGDVMSPIVQADVERILGILRRLLAGTLTLEDVIAQAKTEAPARGSATTRVRFDDTADDGVTSLTVETSDRPGLLLAIARALHRSGVQIVSSEAKTEGDHVVDRFTIVELDGTALGAARRGLLQLEVLTAVDSLGRD